jgi:hypothetical protein
MVLISYLVDPDSGAVYAGVVADDSSVRYVWAPDIEPFWPDDAEQIARRLASVKTKPSTAAEWMDLATYGLGYTEVTKAIRARSTDKAVEVVDDFFDSLAGSKHVEPSPMQAPLSVEAARAFDETMESYPGFGEDDELDADAMTSFVLSLLGPMDPDGPNGWILREIDGKPLPGDENMYVTLDAAPQAAAGQEES